MLVGRKTVRLGDAVPQAPWDFSHFPLLQQRGEEEPGEPPKKSARPLLLARLQSALGFHPWRALSSAGAKGLFPISVSVGVYRAGNGKGEIELIAFGVAAQFALLGQLFQGGTERLGANGAEFAQLLDREDWLLELGQSGTHALHGRRFCLGLGDRAFQNAQG